LLGSGHPAFGTFVPTRYPKDSTCLRTFG